MFFSSTVRQPGMFRRLCSGAAPPAARRFRQQVVGGVVHEGVVAAVKRARTRC